VAASKRISRASISTIFSNFKTIKERGELCGQQGVTQKELKECGEKFWRILLQSVHQAGDGAIELFVGAAELFDLVD
jgi:hypothetical protein